MAFDRRLATHFDWGTLAISLAIIAVSMVLLYSATAERTDGPSGMHWKQLVWTGIGLLAMLAVLCVDYQTLCRQAYVFYGLLLVSLVIVLFFGRVVNGSQRWLALGPWHLQTSELAKPVMILVLARYFAELAPSGTAPPLGFRDLPLPVLLVSVPFVLIVRQPNLSTAMVLVAILCVMVLLIGLRGKTLLTLLSVSLAALPLAWTLLLKEYQRERLLTLFNPQPDLLGAGYHGWQSKIAIGSGGLWGKGLLAGTQSRLSFLPERHTDFIFAVLAEEVGFVGVVILMCLFACLLVQGFLTAYRSRDRLGALIATGVLTMLAVQIFLNIGMTIGLVPIIGLPLPLMSYGGSSLLMTFLCLGLLMNVRMRRFKLGGFPA
ncbi:MAG: rod shape-determining protein RodA [Candidatus Tectomicrobia bacterium]|uniref:Peptidoglycan glycosyltransferase RodA n=1 Tax=Tectimicrobiota bacterium TaxID=2528274 RepID=A0A938B131_UNCTE|nr:rod shape-determining protein RodA [Candidatus Tectomicrobia bacterium]